MSFKDIILKISKETVYLLNDFDDIVIRSNPQEKWLYAKPKRGNEYQIAGDTNLVTDTILQGNEITKEEYEKY